MREVNKLTRRLQSLVPIHVFVEDALSQDNCDCGSLRLDISVKERLVKRSHCLH
jgi:hypothetical protein